MSTLPERFRKPFYVLAFLAATSVLAVAALTTFPLAATIGITAPEIVVMPPDQDCADFSTWEQAQAVYESMPEPYRYDLDRDRDGIACEKLRPMRVVE